MQHYGQEFQGTLSESYIPDDYLVKPEDSSHQLRYSDAEVPLFPNQNSNSQSFGDQNSNAMPGFHITPSHSFLSGNSSGSGPNIMLMQQIHSLQNQVAQYEALITLLQSSTPTTTMVTSAMQRSSHSAESSLLSESASSENQRHDECLYLLDDEEYPFPKYTVSESTVRPYPVMVIRCDGKEKTNLLVKAEPAPGYNFKLDNHIAYYRPKDQGYLHKPIGDIIIFELLHILDIGNAEGEQVQIDFSLYNIEGNNSVLLARRRSPPILVFNHSQYLPAPSIVKIVPSWVTAGATPQLDAYGPLFLRKNNILEAQVLEMDGSQLAALSGKDISRKRNCFHSFTFDAPEHGPGQVSVRARYKGREYGAAKVLDYVPTPRQGGATSKAMSGSGGFNDGSYSGGRGRNNNDRTGGGGGGGRDLGGSSSSDSSTNDYSSNVRYNSYSGKSNVIQYLFQKSIPSASWSEALNGVDANGFTALHWAAYAGNDDCIKELLNIPKLDKTVKIALNARNKFGETPLHLACLQNSVKCVVALLEAGAKPNVLSRDGASPLHIAAYHASSEAVLALLDMADGGEDLLGVADLDGMTPVHYAVLHSNSSALAVLLERCQALGEAIFIRDGEGMSPLHWAAALMDVDCVRELLKVASVKEVNLKDHSGEGALSIAVRTSNIEISRELLDNKSDPNSQDNIGESPIFHAVRGRNDNMLSLLMERGADVALKNKHGDLPFQLLPEAESSLHSSSSIPASQTPKSASMVEPAVAPTSTSSPSTPTPTQAKSSQLVSRVPLPANHTRKQLTPEEIHQLVARKMNTPLMPSLDVHTKAGAEMVSQIQALSDLLERRETDHKAEMASLKNLVQSLADELRTVKSALNEMSSK